MKARTCDCHNRSFLYGLERLSRKSQCQIYLVLGKIREK
nr:MAG TPA: hypothetical protein [Caudoviricetes sp.]